MSLKITWKEGPVYPALIKGPAVGVVDGRLLVAGGMSYSWRRWIMDSGWRLRKRQRQCLCFPIKKLFARRYTNE